MCIVDLVNLICVLVQGSVLTLRFLKTLRVLTWGYWSLWWCTSEEALSLALVL